MGHKHVLYGLCLLLVTPAFSIDLAHVHRLRRQTDDTSEDDRDTTAQFPTPTGSTLPQLTMTELGDKLKDLLDRDRPDTPDSKEKGQGHGRPWDKDDRDFAGLFAQLDGIADRIPDNLTGFDITKVMGQARPAAQAAAQSSRCLKNPNRLRTFMLELRKALRELREDLLEDVTDHDSKTSDTTDTPEVVDDNPMDETDDNPVTTDSDDNPATSNDQGDDTGDDVTTDNGDHDDVDAPFAAPLTTGDASLDQDGSDSKETEFDSIDVEDILEKLSEASMECVSAFLDDKDEEVLCKQLSHQSSRVFQMFMQAGADCEDFLDSNDLDEAHQLALLTHLMSKPPTTWTTQDLQQALALAPDVIDDDLLDQIPEQLVGENLGLLGRLASRSSANPGLLLGFRRRVLAGRISLGDLDASAITGLGKGLLAFSDDDLDDLNPQALLEADLDDLFDDDDDDKDNSKDDDDDDDDNDSLRLALGRRMKQGQISGSRQVGKVARFLYDDLDFLESVDPDDLFDSLSDLANLDLDDDDAANLFRRVSQSTKFPKLEKFDALDIQKVRTVMPGMGLSQLQQLPRLAVRQAIDDLKDLDFDESQARELLEEMFDVEPKDLTATQLRSVGRLAVGLDADDIEAMTDDTVEDLLDDLDDLDLNEAQKRLIVEKARRQATGKPKLLQLPGFAGAVSVNDIDDLDDDVVVTSLNATARINWRASQAATLMNKVKLSLGTRSLRPADLPGLGNLARGLLPRDFDEMVDRNEDVDDLADILSDRVEELLSSQVDKMLDKIEDADRFDDVPEIKVTAEYVAQKGAFLAYLTPGQFKKLEFDDGGKKAFVATMSQMDVRKLSHAQLKLLAEELLDMIEDKVGESQDNADFRKLNLLGQFALGLTPDQIDDLSAEAVLRSMGTLGTLPFTRKQVVAILGKLEEANPEWECRSSILVNAGPLLQFAKEDTIEGLCENELAASFASIEKRLERHREHAEERREEGLWREDSIDVPDMPEISIPDTPDAPDMDDMTEDDSGRQKLVSRMLFAAMATSSRSAASQNAAGRRRRQAQPQLTCSVLRLMRQDVALVDVGLVTSMPHTEFTDCLDVLGNATNWNKTDLQILKMHAIQVLGSPASWTNELIRRAGVLITAFSAEEIRQLMLTGVDALNSVAKHGRLSSEQLAAGFSTWLELKKANNLAAITPGEFSSLSEFVCGLTIAQIEQLSIEVFKQSMDVIGSARSCSSAQRSAYASRALKAYGDRVMQWSPAVVAELGNLIGGLSSPSFQQLTADQLALIKPNVIATIPVTSLKALSDAQLQLLSTNQVNAMKQAQYDGLTKLQQNVINSKATVAFQKATHHAGDGGSTPVMDTGKTTTSASATVPTTSVHTTMVTKTTTEATITTTPQPATTPAIEIITTTKEHVTTAASQGPETTTTNVGPVTTTPDKDIVSTTTEQTTAPPTTRLVPENLPTLTTTTAPPAVDLVTEVTTRRYVQTSTRKAVPVTMTSTVNAGNRFEPTTIQSSVRPDSTRGDVNPWVDQSSEPNNPTTGVKPQDSATHTTGGGNSSGKPISGTSASEENSPSTKDAQHGSTGSAAAGLTWSLTALIATVSLSFLLP